MRRSRPDERGVAEPPLPARATIAGLEHAGHDKDATAICQSCPAIGPGHACVTCPQPPLRNDTARMVAIAEAATQFAQKSAA